MSSSLQSENETPVRAAARAIAQWYGIEVPPYRLPLLEAQLRQLGGHGGPQRGLERLLGHEPDAWDQLIEAVTVPETYLFRHVGHFLLLRSLVEQRRASGLGVRVLSAGCSSGEEVWSAAAVLAQATRLPSTRDSVVGWDINAQRLRQASEGRFRPWSVRAGLHGHDACFRKEGDEVCVVDSLRALVSFEKVNLVGDLPDKKGPFDAILFRNVAIYWDHATAREVACRLAALLAEDGILMIGPSDPASPGDGWEHAITQGVRIYRRCAAAPPPRQAVTLPRSAGGDPAPAPAPRRPVARRLPRSAPALRIDRNARLDRSARLDGQAQVSRRERKTDPPPILGQADLLARVKELADGGRYGEALHQLRSTQIISAEAQLWEGILLLNLDDQEQALDRFRKCVFLAPEQPTYRRWLAIAFQAVGRLEDAAREHRNAHELARR